MTYRSTAIDASCGIRHTALAAEEDLPWQGKEEYRADKEEGGYVP